MAENPEEGGSWYGGWLQGTLQAVKDKTKETLDLVKQDLTEFTCTVSEDTQKVADTVKNKLTVCNFTQENVSAATEKAKQMIGGIYHKAFVIEAEDLHDPGIPIRVGEALFDRAKARLHAIQVDPGTYRNNPDGPEEAFTEWQSQFDLESKKGDISELLVAKTEVRALYTQLVPSQVSHPDFWQRYFYKVHQLEQDNLRRQSLMKRADVTEETKELDWDDDDDEWGDLSSDTSPKKQAATSEDNKNIPQTTQSTEEIQKPAKPVEKSPEQSQAETVNSANSESDITTQTKTESVQEPSPTPNEQTVSSPSETESSLSPNTETSSKDMSLSSETLTAVSSEAPSTGESFAAIPSEADKMIEAQSAPGEVKSESAVEEKEVKTREKGDLVVVGSGSDRTTPSSDTNGSNATKESTSIDDDWEKDFDIEVTEEDLRKAEEAAKNIKLDDANPDGDDWEDWE